MNIGIIAGSRYYGRFFHCSCGLVSDKKTNESYECPKCQNKRFIRFSSVDRWSTIYSSIKVNDKNNYSFDIDLTEYKCKGNKDDGYQFKIGKTNNIKFCLKNGYMKVNGYSLGVPSVMARFRTINQDEFLEKVATDKNKELYKYAKRIATQNQETSSNLGRGLLRLSNKPWVEKLVSYGFDHLWIFRTSHIIKKDENKLHKMIGVPKYALEYIKKCRPYLARSLVQTIRKLERELNGNDLKNLLEYFDTESSLDSIEYCNVLLLELVKNYEYKDIFRLVKYITRDVKLEQGISSPREALQLLRDYVNMCKLMQIKPEKYPKSLKKNA